MFWAGACLALLFAVSQPALALEAGDDCNSESDMMMAASVAMQASSIESPLLASRRWVKGPEAHAWYREALAADLAFRDADAAAAYRAVLQIDPYHVESLHRLAYLQAASDDPTVRNQIQAMVNSERALDLVLNMSIQRRSLSPDTVRTLGALRVDILNALAAVAAAGGNFSRASGLVESAIRKARSIAEADPSSQNHLAIVRLQNNLATLQARQPLRVIRQVQ